MTWKTNLSKCSKKTPAVRMQVSSTYKIGDGEAIHCVLTAML